MPSEPDDPDNGGTGDWTRALRDAGPYLSLGATLATTVLLGVGLGYGADRWWGTQPTFLLLGGVLGVGLALYQFFMTVGRRQ